MAGSIETDLGLSGYFPGQIPVRKGSQNGLGGGSFAELTGNPGRYFHDFRGKKGSHGFDPFGAGEPVMPDEASLDARGQEMDPSCSVEIRLGIPIAGFPCGKIQKRDLE